MKKTRKQPPDGDTMRPEYDFSRGARGKYAARLPGDVTFVLLEPDVAAAYPDSQSVNRALRAILDAAPRRPRKARRRTA